MVGFLENLAVQYLYFLFVYIYRSLKKYIKNIVSVVFLKSNGYH